MCWSEDIGPLVASSLRPKRLRGCSMVVVQQSTKALLTLHSSSRLNRSRWRDDQSIRHTLMVSRPRPNRPLIGVEMG